MLAIFLEFAAPSRTLLLKTLLTLPDNLCPNLYRLGDDEQLIPVGDSQKFVATIEQSGVGPILNGPAGDYYISFAGDKPIKCWCYLNIDPSNIVPFFESMAKANPVFGFACLREELSSRNQLTTSLGPNNIDMKVGRDVSKYIPGLYWITLVSGGLLRQHGVSVDTLANSAIANHEVSKEHHIIQFYENPEDWENSDLVPKLIREQDGVFDIESAASDFKAANTFLQLNEIAAKWS